MLGWLPARHPRAVGSPRTVELKNRTEANPVRSGRTAGSGSAGDFFKCNEDHFLGVTRRGRSASDFSAGIERPPRVLRVAITLDDLVNVTSYVDSLHRTPHRYKLIRQVHVDFQRSPFLPGVWTSPLRPRNGDNFTPSPQTPASPYKPSPAPPLVYKAAP
jgi:hypothetical protein